MQTQPDYVEVNKTSSLPVTEMKSNGKLEAFFFTKAYLKSYGQNHMVEDKDMLLNFLNRKFEENRNSILGPVLLILVSFILVCFNWGFNWFVFYLFGIFSLAFILVKKSENKALKNFFKADGSVSRKEWLDGYWKERNESFFKEAGVNLGLPLYLQQEEIYHLMTWAINLKEVLIPLDKLLDKGDFLTGAKITEIRKKYYFYNMAFKNLENSFNDFKKIEASSENEEKLKEVFASFKNDFLNLISAGLSDNGFLSSFVEDKTLLSKSPKGVDKFEEMKKRNQQILLNKASEI